MFFLIFFLFDVKRCLFFLIFFAKFWTYFFSFSWNRFLAKSLIFLWLICFNMVTIISVYPQLISFLAVFQLIRGFDLECALGYWDCYEQNPRWMDCYNLKFIIGWCKSPKPLWENGSLIIAIYVRGLSFGISRAKSSQLTWYTQNSVYSHQIFDRKNIFGLTLKW